MIEGQSQPKVSSQENTSSFYPSLQVPAWTQHLPNPTGNQKVRKPSDIVIKGQPPRIGEWLEKDRKGIWRSKRQLSSTCGGFPWSTEQLSNRRNKNTGFLTLILKPFPCMPLCVLWECVFSPRLIHMSEYTTVHLEDRKFTTPQICLAPGTGWLKMPQLILPFCG